MQAKIEWLPQLYHDYEPQNVLNINELGLLFKALPEKGLQW